MQFLNIDGQEVEQKNLITSLNKAIIKEYLNLEKHRRFKVGCKPTVCVMERLMFLSDNICTDKCYLTEDDYKIIKENIKKYG